MKKLENKVAVVTGASKGIDAGIARGLAAEGAAVIVNYSSAKGGAEKVVAEIIAAGGRAVAVQADVSNSADVDRLYSETKSVFGDVDVVVVLSKELGPKKIRVNAINPGMVETEGTHTAGFIGSDFQKQVEQQVPLGRISVPEDIAPIAVFLASDDSGWLIGETLIASGGLR